MLRQALDVSADWLELQQPPQQSEDRECLKQKQRMTNFKILEACSPATTQTFLGAELRSLVVKTGALHVQKNMQLLMDANAEFVLLACAQISFEAIAQNCRHRSLSCSPRHRPAKHVLRF